MSLSARLDQLEAAVRRASRVPITGLCLVDPTELLGLIEQARSSLPEEVAQAREVFAGRDSILQEAHVEADRLVSAARRRAETEVEESRIVVRARGRGEEIVQAARDEASRLRSDADDYCDRRLALLEADLHRALAQLGRGRERLQARLGEEPDLPALDLDAIERGANGSAERASGLGHSHHLQ